MAVGTILGILSNIGPVIDTAPKVVDLATKLWNTVTRKKSDQSLDMNDKSVADTTQSEVEVLRMRLTATEEHIRDLDKQMSLSAELINQLAEQNMQLVNKIKQIALIAKVTAIIVIALVGGVVYMLLRS